MIPPPDADHRVRAEIKAEDLGSAAESIPGRQRLVFEDLEP